MSHNKLEERGRMLYVSLLDICGGHLELYAFGVFSLQHCGLNPIVSDIDYFLDNCVGHLGFE